MHGDPTVRAVIDECLLAIAGLLEEEPALAEGEEGADPFVPASGERRCPAADVNALRHRIAAARWATPTSREDNLPLKIVHRDSLWAPPDRSEPEATRRRSAVVLDALDFLVASMGADDEVVFAWREARS